MRRSLRALLARVTGPDPQQEPPARFQLDGFQVSDLRLVRKPFGFFNKAGRLSWTARLNGRRVKLFECADARQAELVERVSNESAVAGAFPRCVVRRDRIIGAEWIEGEVLTWREMARSPDLLDQAARLLAEIHSLESAAARHPGYPTYFRYLVERVERFRGIAPLDDLLGSVERRLEADAGANEVWHVSHPDFVPRNLVRRHDTGRVALIDNELMDVSPWPAFDLLNTFFSLPAEAVDFSRRFLRCYREAGGDPSSLLREWDRFRALWCLRRVGSELQTGSVGRALAAANEHARGREAEPPLLELVREITEC